MRVPVKRWLVAVALTLTVAAPGVAQSTPVATADPAGTWVRAGESRIAPLRRTVSVRLSGTPLPRALDAIGRSAGLRVTYGEDVLFRPVVFVGPYGDVVLNAGASGLVPLADRTMDITVGATQLIDDFDGEEFELRAVVDAAHRHGAITKVIFENDFLTSDEQKTRLCQISEGAGAEFVKTSTGYAFVKQPGGGYNYRGATEHDVRLMRKHCSAKVQIKAAGCVRTYADAVRMRELGCTRIGASATEAIIAEERRT